MRGRLPSSEGNSVTPSSLTDSSILEPLNFVREKVLDYLGNHSEQQEENISETFKYLKPLDPSIQDLS